MQAARSRHSASKNVYDRKKQLQKANQLSDEELRAASDQVDEAKAGLDAERAKKTELELLKPQPAARPRRVGRAGEGSPPRPGAASP